MNKNQNNKASNGNVNKKPILIASSVIIVIALFVFFSSQNKPQASSANLDNPPVVSVNDAPPAISGDLTILKAEITEEATFYPYQSNDTYMEVIAVRASDGSVRTALNTCQVCYNSGKGYYEQSGEVLVCNNCGNRFTVDQIELIKGGCNPVPITEDLKTESEEEILITADALAGFEAAFANWKRE